MPSKTPICENESHRKREREKEPNRIFEEK